VILITGAAGGIGNRMAQRFIEKGIDFIGIDYIDNPGLPASRFQKCDVRDPAVADIIEEHKITAIVHLAFCTKPKTQPKLQNDIDLNGSRNIADCAVQKGVKNIVFASSGRVYGNRNLKGGMTDNEGNYLNPLDDTYACNKIKAEKIFQNVARDQSFKLAILRLAIVCRRGGGMGIGDMLNSTSKTGRFITFGKSNPPMQLVHVDDVIDSFNNAIGKEGIFDIAAEGTLTLLELFTQAAIKGGKKPNKIQLPYFPVLGLVHLMWKCGLCPVPPCYVKLGTYDITRDISKTVNTLGKPRYTIEQVLDEVVSPPSGIANH
jgi:UDP-glucose 4-epimerase